MAYNVVTKQFNRKKNDLSWTLNLLIVGLWYPKSKTMYFYLIEVKQCISIWLKIKIRMKSEYYLILNDTYV